MLFHFQLRPVADVTAWGSANQPHLHWFGLTDGWYWLQMNENNEFFRYSTQLLHHWRESHPEAAISLPYVDYYVVRLWEDILTMLPDILEPLPPNLAQMLETEEKVSQWQKQVNQWGKEIELEDETWETYSQAITWWDNRKLNAGYLTTPPCLWFWNDGYAIHCFWDNSHIFSKDHPAWDAQKGHIRLTRAQFLDEVDSFHTRLFTAMENRIQEAKISWSRPDVALDMVTLEKENQDRSQWLARSKDRADSRIATPWDAVVDAIRTLERFPAEESEDNFS